MHPIHSRSNEWRPGKSLHPSTPQKTQGRPWYRERWIWFLAAGPLAVIVAGVATLWLAIRSDDGLVADDYYRQGLAINRALERDKVADALGMNAILFLEPERGRLRLVLTGAKSGGDLRLQIVHPTQAGKDRIVVLTPVAPGVYEGAFVPLLDAGRWRVMLEDAGRTWRLAGEWSMPGSMTLTLAPPRRNP